MAREFAISIYKSYELVGSICLAYLDLSEKQLAQLKKETEDFMAQYHNDLVQSWVKAGLTRTPEAQLIDNIGKEISEKIYKAKPVIVEYAPEKVNNFMVNEFNKLPKEERFCMILWIIRDPVRNYYFHGRIINEDLTLGYKEK